ncbi:Dual specificity phosphatase 12 [Balamuthia mandrillaris]
MEEQGSTRRGQFVLCHMPEFFSCASCFEYLVLDFRTREEFDACHIKLAQNLPVMPSPSSEEDEDPAFEDKFGFERQDKVLVYTSRASAGEDIIAQLGTDARIEFLRQNDRLREILVLKGGFEEFYQHYPFLCRSTKEDEERNNLTQENFDSQLLEPIYPAQLSSYLFLGSEASASEKTVFQELGITHIVNATIEIKSYFEQDTNFTYLRLPLRDAFNEDIFSHFSRVNQFINEARNGGGRVLIHCAQGVSRSATLALSHLMQTQKWTMEKSLWHVRRVRWVRPNESFQQQLLLWESQVFGSNDEEQPAKEHGGLME